MTAAQRIYPGNGDEQKATHQHGRKSSLTSEKTDPASHSGQIIHFKFPKEQVFPSREAEAPRYESRPAERRRNLCCRCLLWSVCLFLFLIVIIAIASVILYAVFRPRVPKFSVENIQITSFAIATDSKVSSQFAVGMIARNPNKKMGIYYLDDIYLAIFYTGRELCRGNLPVFYQGHKNRTNLDVTLTGTDVEIPNEIVTSLNAEQQQGSIPLRLKADVPVNVEFGKLKTPKITFRVRCDVVVDKLAPNTTVIIIKNKCKVKI